MQLLKQTFSPLSVFISVQIIEDMNIHSRKLVLIEALLRISDESLITKLELFIRDEKETAAASLRQFSIATNERYHSMQPLINYHQV